MSSLLRIGAASFVCLLPLAVYLLFLARLNYRRRPTLVTGRWDFTWLLLGLSGFLLVGGPIMVSLLDSTWRALWFAGNFEDIRRTWRANALIWPAIVCGYLLLVCGLIALFMLMRQPVTVIYNVAAAELPQLVETALRNRGLQWKQGHGGIEIGRFAEGDGARLSASSLYGYAAFLSVESFPSMCHASLRWRNADPALRAEIETELATVLGTAESPENPSAGWLTTASATLFVVVFGWLGFLTWIVVTAPRGF